jgi:mannose-6-phosphate isomerase-like protein (cupin superfamily)
MITKLVKDHQVKLSPFCGEIREILSGREYSPDVALAINIKPTTAHYHEGFDEIYFVLDGSLILKLFEPGTEEITQQELNANELCVISKGVHHKVLSASIDNRLCVLCMPRFDPSDEHPSGAI